MVSKIGNLYSVTSLKYFTSPSNAIFNPSSSAPSKIIRSMTYETCLCYQASNRCFHIEYLVALYKVPRWYHVVKRLAHQQARQRGERVTSFLQVGPQCIFLIPKIKEFDHKNVLLFWLLNLQNRLVDNAIDNLIGKRKHCMLLK